jgi:hypothetical protein
MVTRDVQYGLMRPGFDRPSYALGAGRGIARQDDDVRRDGGWLEGRELEVEITHDMEAHARR